MCGLAESHSGVTLCCGREGVFGGRSSDPRERSLAVHTRALSMDLSEQFPVWGLVLSPSLRRVSPPPGGLLPGRLQLLIQLRNEA